MTCTVISRPKLGKGTFLKFLGAQMIYNAKSVFPAINASSRWFTNVVGVCLVHVSLLLICQQGLGDFFRSRTLLIDWGIVPIYANAIGKQPRQRQLLPVQGMV
jgi:hypothetical protein